MTIRNHPNVGARSPIPCRLEGCSVSSAGASNPQYRHLSLSWHGNPAAPLYVRFSRFRSGRMLPPCSDLRLLTSCSTAVCPGLWKGARGLPTGSRRAFNWQPTGSHKGAGGLAHVSRGAHLIFPFSCSMSDSIFSKSSMIQSGFASDRLSSWALP